MRRFTEDPHPILSRPGFGLVDSPGYRADETLKPVGLASVVLPQVARQEHPRMGRPLKRSADLTTTFRRVSSRGCESSVLLKTRLTIVAGRR